MKPELVEEFVRAFHAELNRQRREAEISAGSKRRELENVRRKLENLLDAVADGFKAPELQERLSELSRRKAELENAIARDSGPLPRLHPNLAELYRRKVEQLHSALREEATRDQAVAILRNLIERIVVHQRPHGFEFELVGEIANIVALPTENLSSRGDFRRSIKVVAEEGLSQNPTSESPALIRVAC